MRAHAALMYSEAPALAAAVAAAPVVVAPSSFVPTQGQLAAAAAAAAASVVRPAARSQLARLADAGAEEEDVDWDDSDEDDDVADSYTIGGSAESHEDDNAAGNDNEVMAVPMAAAIAAT